MKTINYNSFFLNKEVWFQIICWTLFLAAINVNWSDTWIKNSFLPESVAPHIALAMPIVFLLNAFWLIPKYLNKKNWYNYLWISLSLLIGFEIIRSVVFTIVLHEENALLNTFKNKLFGETSLVFGLLYPLTFHVIFYSFAYRFTRDWLMNQSIIETLKLEKQRLELNSLQFAGQNSFINDPIRTNDFIPAKTDSQRKKSFRKIISVKKRDGTFLLKIEDIIYFQAQGDFLFAFDKDNAKHIINESLKTTREQVCSQDFFQINRSELVNFNYINKYSSYTKNRLEITLVNSKEPLYTSNSRTPDFRNWIEQH